MRGWVKPGALIIIFASVVHLTWAFALLFATAPVQTTGVSLIINLFGNVTFLAVSFFCLASFMAQFSIFHPSQSLMRNVWLIMPQQFLLLVSAIGATICIIEGRFADGAIYPPIFILADQGWLIYLAFLHSMAVIANHVILYDIYLE